MPTIWYGSWGFSSKGHRSRIRQIRSAVCARCRYSGHAGSASDGHAAGIRRGCDPRSRVRRHRRRGRGRCRCGCRRGRYGYRPPAPGMCHHMFRTTLAVLRPTPGRIAARRGWRAPRRHSRGSGSRQRMTFFALLRNRPMVLMCSIRPAFAQGQHLFGACRRRRTARAWPCSPHIGGLRRQGHGDQQGEGVGMVQFALGFGSAAWNRVKISWIVA
jgi:hypothetical protein